VVVGAEEGSTAGTVVIGRLAGVCTVRNQSTRTKYKTQDESKQVSLGGGFFVHSCGDGGMA